MNYTCALFDGTTDLDEAQNRKLAFLHHLARITPGKRVLDIGCGWGANLEYLSTQRGVLEAHGITLSRAQYDEIARRRLLGVTASVADYRTYAPPCRFDAVMCICMMEHIATPEEARRGENIALYRAFFRRAHAWTTSGSWFALQAILRSRVPRDGRDLREIGWATRYIFPGGIALRLEEVAESVAPYWEIEEVYTRRSDYQQTTRSWRDRLRRHEGVIRWRWSDAVFEDYERYLSICVRAFEQNYMSLGQFALRRVD